MIIPDTYFTLSEEVRLFGLSCLGGAAVGAAFDVIRAFRLIVRHNDILINAEDLFFLGLYGTALTAFSDVVAKGDLRLYFAIGNVLGFAFYYVTVGRAVVKTIRKLFYAAGTLFKLVVRPLELVFAPLCKKATVKFVRNHRINVKLIKKIQIVLLNGRYLLYNKMENKKRKNVKNVAEKNET